MLRALWRLILGGFALALAVPFASFVLGAGIYADPALRGALLAFLRAGFGSGLWDLLYTFSPATLLDGVVGFLKVLLLVVTLPPALAALIGETFRFRAAAWYGGASGLLSASLPWLAQGDVKASPAAAALLAEGRVVGILFVTGAASGLVYWAIAGRGAGPRPRRREAGETSRMPRLPAEDPPRALPPPAERSEPRA